jgi:hypothetical protein
MLRNMRLVLGGLLLLLCVGCGGGESDGEPFALYHLESAIGPPGADGELRCGPPRPVCPGILQESPKRVSRYPVLAEPALTDDHIERSSVRRAADPSTGTPVVLVDFTTEGREAFAQVTKRAARVGGRDQGWNHVAVVVGDEIVSFPQIDFDVYPDGIPNAPGIQIAAANDADARELVRRLRGEGD